MATVTQGRLVYEGGRARLPRSPILHVLEKDSKGTRQQCLAGFLQGRSRHLAKFRSKKTVEPSCYEPSWCMIKMTEKAPEPHVEEDDDELDGKLNYKPPPQKSLKELQEMDKDDESLTKYKKTLLGDGPVVAGDLEALKKETFVLKEGVEYRVKINFKVNKDIVSGLKYVQHTYRTGVKVDKATFMVGSYGPRPEEYEFLTPIEEAPKGMLARGTYHNKSFFTDDDKHDHLTWEWNLSIKKDWTE
nr:rho GDP-dissociation inhibitor 2 isoform X2 [Bubalus bubalis]